MAKISGVGVAALAGGSILTYSAATGRSVSSVFRALLAGQSPSTALSSLNGPVGSSGTGGGVTSLGGAGFHGVVSVGTPAPGEKGWIVAMLTALGAPSTDANIKSIQSWIAREGPYGTQGENNPLNTSWTNAPDYAGKWSLAPVVSMYSSVTGGIIATVDTLLSGNYADVVGALRSGQGLCGRDFAGLHTWSGGGYSRVC